MRVSTQLPHHDLRKVQAFAQKMERAGLDTIVALENQHNPFLPLAVAALVTERIQLGTAVAIAFPRSPTITAMEAWDLQAASNGRFYLGLGSQVKGHNERRYGLTWTPPGPRMRDYIGATRAVWRAWEKEEPLNFLSENYSLTLMTPNFSPMPGWRAAIVNAANSKSSLADSSPPGPIWNRCSRCASTYGFASPFTARPRPTGMC